MSKVKGTRLDDELAAWVEQYAVSRGTDAATVLRMAVVAFRRDCAGGVPDIPEPLPEPVVATRSSTRTWPPPGVRSASSFTPAELEAARDTAARQRRLNDAKARAR